MDEWNQGWLAAFGKVAYLYETEEEAKVWIELGWHPRILKLSDVEVTDIWLKNRMVHVEFREIKQPQC